ncbi:MAG TPA: ABC transporter permease, partial [Arenibaculum sp.]|nr:ABC transporter permease [Arenibaculum sp.]
MTGRRFSAARVLALMLKEFIQMRRDRLTFAMMIGIPVIQLLLFGFAINADPKHLPTAVLSADDSEYARSLIAAMDNSGYFDVDRRASGEAGLTRLLERGEVQFAVTIPAGFGRDLVRGDRPVLLVEADATDPAATGNALGALEALMQGALAHDLTGPLAGLAGDPGPVELRIHRRYNPEGITQYNIVPGLMGVIMTMTMVMMTALAMTRERERGTMENLLAMPVRPAEVMLGKIVPPIFVAYVQMALILLAARLLFGVPMAGSTALLATVLILFVAANLAVGFTFSTIARNQLQAMQMSFFFFLPSILLSGFMFPFAGMPDWAQAIGEVLPLTHF